MPLNLQTELYTIAVIYVIAIVLQQSLYNSGKWKGSPEQPGAGHAGGELWEVALRTVAVCGLAVITAPCTPQAVCNCVCLYPPG